jgi:hypothetical protein
VCKKTNEYQYQREYPISHRRIGFGICSGLPIEKIRKVIPGCKYVGFNADGHNQIIGSEEEKKKGFSV